MNLPASWSPPVGEDAERFQRLGRRMVRDARKWAAKLARHAIPRQPETAQRVFRETLTFAAFLITDRAREAGLHFSDSARRELSALLRAEFERALADLHDDGSTAASNFGDGLETQLALYSTGGPSGPEITPGGFARFCQVTGMHSTALVGAGPNLAHIFFYLRLFAIIDADERLTLEQRKHLLRAAQECREHFATLTESAPPDAAPSPALSAATNVVRVQAVAPHPHALDLPSVPRSP